MAPESNSLRSHVPEAESMRNIVESSVIESAASEYSGNSKYCTPDNAELNYTFFEIFGACWAVNTVSAKKRGDKLLIAAQGQKVYFS